MQKEIDTQAPFQAVDVTDTDDLNEHDEEQWEGTGIVIEDGEPVVPWAGGEAQAEEQTEETYQTCQPRHPHMGKQDHNLTTTGHKTTSKSKGQQPKWQPPELWTSFLQLPEQVSVKCTTL